MKIGATVGVGAVACALALALTPASAQASGLSVSGHVTCAHGQHVEGVWVQSSGGGSNFAGWRATSAASASYTSWVATSLPTAISLHVGCGGSTAAWASDNYTPAVVMVTAAKTINATDCMNGSCAFPLADRAATWAENHLTGSGGGNQALTSDKVTDTRAYTSWAGLDLAFAVSAYLNAAGFWPRPNLKGSTATPNDMYQMYANDHLVQSTWDTSGGSDPYPPRGALVFYPNSASSGQIAISAGGGQVISANSSGSPLVREQGYTSIPGYQGWAIPSNMVDGHSGPLPQPIPVSPAPRPSVAVAAHPKAAVAAHPPLLIVRSPPPHPSAGPHRSWVKYYIVPPARNGQKAGLFEIAAQTLGNGGLYKEIFNLNRGRLQPDGARLENPAAIDPGWILILPADAHGPGVHFGPLPVPHPAGQPATGGAVRVWISRALTGCLILLGMIITVLVARAGLMARRQYGRHRYPRTRSHSATRARQGVSRGMRREVEAGTGQPARLSRTAIAGVMSPPEPPAVPAPAVPAPAVPAPAVPAPAVPAPAVPAPAVPAPAVPAPAVPAPATSPGADRPAQAGGRAVPAQVPCSPSQASAVPAGGLGGQGGSEGAPPVPAVAADRGAGGLGGTGGEVFSAAALRLLGVRSPAAGKDADGGGAVQRHEVVLGDFQVQAVLAAAPASSRRGRSAEAQTWVASAPYLVWTPLPHDVPSGGLAFACVGAGSAGCLFIDLAAAPGAVALGGEREAAARLAESVAYQLCSGPAAGRVHLVVVGDAVSAPLPPGMEWIASAADLGSRARAGPGGEVELVFCRPGSNEDVFPLARYVASAPYRVVPLILADLPGAPWSFTAHPSRQQAGVLQPVVS